MHTKNSAPPQLHNVIHAHPQKTCTGVLDAELFQLYTPHDYEAQEQLQDFLIQHSLMHPSDIPRLNPEQQANISFMHAFMCSCLCAPFCIHHSAPLRQSAQINLNPAAYTCMQAQLQEVQRSAEEEIKHNEERQLFHLGRPLRVGQPFQLLHIQVCVCGACVVCMVVCVR